MAIEDGGIVADRFHSTDESELASERPLNQCASIIVPVNMSAGDAERNTRARNTRLPSLLSRDTAGIATYIARKGRRLPEVAR